MKVFLSHSTKDKDIVEPIAFWLRNHGLSPWIDRWELTAGDSLIERLGDAIEASNRLAIFLSPASIESEWVSREVAGGLIMEIAESKGAGKFLVPALLAPCKIPFFLKDKIYANFTNKTFDAACEELRRGILDERLGPQEAKFDNRVVAIYPVPVRTPSMRINARPSSGKHAAIIELGIRACPIAGFKTVFEFEFDVFNMIAEFAPPHSLEVLTFNSLKGLTVAGVGPRRFALSATIELRTTRSLYLYLESDEPIANVQVIQFTDSYGRSL